MKAAVLADFGQPLSIEELATPQPRDDEVLIEVEACGVCHSDLHIVDGDLPRFRAATKARLIPGHEVVGRVVGRGPGVSGLELGERVGVPWQHACCGQCAMCLDGHENLCAKGSVTGMTVDGGYAQFMRACASHALRIPDGLQPHEVAPLFCAGVTSYRALKNAGVAPGRRVAVFGIGGLGHLAVQIARAMGAEVVGVDVAPDKLALAMELGAVVGIDASNAQALKGLRQSGGVHVAVVTSAAHAAYAAALQCLRPTGTLSVVGLPPQPLQFPALSLVAGEYRIVGSSVGTREDVRAVLEMASVGRLRCRVQTRPLGQVNAVLDEMRRGEIQGRVVLDPRA